MHVDRLLRLLPDGNWTLEAGVAAVAGFLAGRRLDGGWSWVDRIMALLIGG